MVVYRLAGSLASFNDPISFFSFSFFIQIKERRKRDYKGGFLPLLIQTKERKRDKVGMYPNTRFEAAHLATWCAPKLAHLEIFKAFQEGMENN